LKRARSHLVIPDTQCRPGISLDYLWWVGRYIADRKPDVVIHLGDHWDMPSLSSYDRGKRAFEGRRYRQDIEAGNEGMERLMRGMGSHRPRLVFLIGNHEERISRLTQAQPELHGSVGYDDFHLPGWEMHDFLEPIVIDGVKYCHFFPRSGSGAITQTKRGAPSARAQLVREGGSCTAGHQQGLDVACVPLRGRLQWGLVAGSCYLHNEDYLSPQGTTYWRGVIVKHEVDHGSYSPMFVSLEYLRRRYASR
jgi:hypothetical protein